MSKLINAPRFLLEHNTGTDKIFYCGQISYTYPDSKEAISTSKIRNELTNCKIFLIKYITL